MNALWDITPCSLVEVGRRFRGEHCLHYQGDGLLHAPRRLAKVERSFRGAYCLHYQGDGLLKRDYTALYPRNLSS